MVETTPDLHGILSAFFADYAAAINANDEDVILSFLATPHGIRTGEQTVFLETTEEVRTNMDEVLTLYEANGVEHVVPHLDEAKDLPANAAAARIDWRLEDGKGNALLTFESRYTLAAEDNVWAIVAVDATDEVAAWDRAGWRGDLASAL
ncbi:MAG: hypothetical protein AAF205_02980 [Pseudomonadota bacterium]